jgi:chaperonin cofactor prefoldin
MTTQEDNEEEMVTVAQLDERLNELAAMIAAGFANTATKDDLHELEERLSQRIDNVEQTLDTAIRRLDKRIDMVQDQTDVLASRTKDLEVIVFPSS